MAGGPSSLDDTRTKTLSCLTPPVKTVPCIRVLGVVAQVSLPGLYKKPAYGSCVGGGGAGVDDLAGVGIRVGAGRGAEARVGVGGCNAAVGGTSVGGEVGGAEVNVGLGAVRVTARVGAAPPWATMSATRQPSRISHPAHPRAMSVCVDRNGFTRLSRDESDSQTPAGDQWYRFTWNRNNCTGSFGSVILAL